jgi:hypothetical protein
MRTVHCVANLLGGSNLFIYSMKTLLLFLFSACISEAAIRDAKNYGASGNGSVDDTAAIQNAFNSCTKGDTLYIPSGTYKISSKLLYSGAGISVRGDGMGNSTLILSASNSIALEFLIASEKESLNLSEFTVSTTGTGNTAIRVSYPLTASTHLNTSLNAFHVGIRSDSGTWTKGLSLNHTWNSKIDSCYFSNPTSISLTGTGILVESMSVGINVTNTSLSFWQKGIEIGQGATNNEGLIVDHCLFVPVTFGIYHNPSTPQTLPLYISVSNSHIDARGSFCACVYLNGCYDAQLANNNFFVVAQEAGQQGYCVLLNGKRSLIQGNRFTKTALPGAPSFSGSGGIVMLGAGNQPSFTSSDSLLASNSFLNFDAGATIWIQSGCQNIKVLGNQFISCTWPLYDQGTGTVNINN